MYEFDFKEFWQAVKKGKRLIITNCVIAAVAAVVIGYSIPKEYTSNCELAVETAGKGGIGGSASSLAALAGIQLNNGTEALGPSLYPNVVESNNFAIQLLGTPVETLDGSFKGSFRDYITNHQRSAWWSWPTKWIKGLFADETAKTDSCAAIDPERMTPEEYTLIEAIRSVVKCDLDEKKGTIKINVRTQDALVSKLMVDAAEYHLQEFVIRYRTNKARMDLEYYQKLEQEAKENYIAARNAYAHYSDTHQDLSSSKYKLEMDGLENELQLVLSAYGQMKQQVQIAHAKVQESTPVFTEISKASVPLNPASPKKKLILIAMVFLGALGTVGWIYCKLLFFTHKPVEASQQA